MNKFAFFSYKSNKEIIRRFSQILLLIITQFNCYYITFIKPQEKDKSKFIGECVADKTLISLQQFEYKKSGLFRSTEIKFSDPKQIPQSSSMISLVNEKTIFVRKNHIRSISNYNTTNEISLKFKVNPLDSTENISQISFLPVSLQKIKGKYQQLFKQLLEIGQITCFDIQKQYLLQILFDLNVFLRDILNNQLVLDQPQLNPQICVKGQFYSIETQSCQYCDKFCETCNSSGFCLTCDEQDNRELDENFQCVCKANYYTKLQSDKLCQVCPYYCGNCSYQDSQFKCNYCPKYDKFKRNNDSSCSCSFGYYQNQEEDLCVQCTDNCTDCDQNKCKNNKCGSNCFNCSSNWFESCVSCSPFYIKQNGGCVKDCESGYYSQVFSCKKCDDENCDECSSLTGNCKTCKQEFQLKNNICVMNKCPERQFKISDVLCEKCFDQNCLNCTGGQQNQCTKCAPNSYLQNGLCIKCNDENCNECNNLSNICLVCKQGFKLENNKCIVDTCPQSYYKASDTLCEKCYDFQNCLQCSGKKEYECIKCTLNSYLQNGICEKCNDVNCQDCSGGFNQCKSCIKGFEVDNNSCIISKCPEKYFKNYDKCEKCFDFENCLQCTGKQENQCSVCKPNTYLQDGKCKNQCDETHYHTISSNICIECKLQYCKTCSYDSNGLFCKQCYDQYELKNNACEASCLYGEAKDPLTQQCKNCLPNCKNCNDSFQTCNECMFEYYLIGNDKCEKKCPPNYIQTNNKCVPNDKIPDIQKVNAYSQENNTIIIEFDRDIPQIELLCKEFTIEIPEIDKKNYNYDCSKANNKQIKILITPSNPINTKKTVKILNSNNNVNIPKISPNTVQVNIFKEELDKGSKGVVEKLSNLSKATSTATLAVMIPLAFSGSFWIISSLLDICQLIYLTEFINISAPSNLDEFLKSQKSFQVPFYNYFQKMHNYENINYHTFQKIENNGLQGFLLSNLGDSISLTVTIFLGMLVLLFISYIFRKSAKISKYINLVKGNVICAPFILDLLWSIYLDISFSTVIQIFSIEKPNHFVEYINYIFFAIALISTALPLFITIMVYKQLFSNVEKSMGENLKIPSYRLILYLRKFVYTIAAAAFQLSANTQNSLLVSFHIFLLIYLFQNKPFHSKFDNYKEVIQTVFFLISSIQYIFLINKQFESQDNRVIFGWWIIATFWIVILCDLVFCIKELIITIRDFVKRYKQKKIELVKVHPISSAISPLQSNSISPLEKVKSFDMQNQSGLETMDSPKRRRQRPSQNKSKFQKQVRRHLSILNSNSVLPLSANSLSDQQLPQLSDIRYLDSSKLSPHNNIENGLDMISMLKEQKIQNQENEQLNQINLRAPKFQNSKDSQFSFNQVDEYSINKLQSIDFGSLSKIENDQSNNQENSQLNFNQRLQFLRSKSTYATNLEIEQN